MDQQHYNIDHIIDVMQSGGVSRDGSCICDFKVQNTLQIKKFITPPYISLFPICKVQSMNNQSIV